MATVDFEKLVVQMSADLRSYENTMARAVGLTRQQFKQIRADAAGAGDATAVALTGAARGVQRFGNQAAVAARQAGALRAQTGNLGAQFQDIAVQLQSGQSPFTIALQQGTQIAAVLGSTGGGAAGAVRALGGAFASLVSPVSLVTIGLIAAGGAAIQYFSSLGDGGEKSEEDLKRQSDLVRQLAKDWGEAIPALKTYADEMDRLKVAGDLGEAEVATLADIWAQVREEMKTIGPEVEDLIAKLTRLGADTTAIVELQEAFADLAAKVKDGSAEQEDADRATAALNATMDSGIPIAADLAAAMATLAGYVDSAARAASAAEAQFDAARDAMQRFRSAELESRRLLPVSEAAGERALEEMDRRRNLTKEQLELEEEIADVKRRVADAGGVADPAEIERAAKANIDAANARAEAAKAARSSGGGGGGGGRSSEVDREREAVAKLIEQLRFEHSLIGLTALEREKEIQLRRAGAAATVDQRKEIEAQVTASYLETEAMRQTSEQLENLKGLSKDVLGGMFEDLRDGADAADVLANALNRVAENMVQIGIDRLIEGAFAGVGQPSSGTSLLSRLFHNGGVVGQPGPGRMVPAALFAGAPRYHGGGIAGMRPGEVPAILKRGETVLPVGASGGAVVVNINNAPPGTRTEERQGPDGSRQIEVWIAGEMDKALSTGRLDRTLRNNFGVSRMPRGR